MYMYWEWILTETQKYMLYSIHTCTVLYICRDQPGFKLGWFQCIILCPVLVESFIEKLHQGMRVKEMEKKCFKADAFNPRVHKFKIEKNIYITCTCILQNIETKDIAPTVFMNNQTWNLHIKIRNMHYSVSSLELLMTQYKEVIQRKVV